MGRQNAPIHARQLSAFHRFEVNPLQFPSFSYFCTKFQSSQDMFEDEEEDFFEYEEEMGKAVERYESMLEENDSQYFDSEEFEYIIDHTRKTTS